MEKIISNAPVERVVASMSEGMVCDICGSKTEVRHGLDLRLGVWCCPRCLDIYRSIHKHYSSKGYSNERCMAILRGVVEKQKRLGQWEEDAA
jgi:ribosomal protein L37AE/L43A